MSFFKTWKEIMFNPTKFFELLPDEKEYTEPFVFYTKILVLVMTIVYLILMAAIGVAYSLGQFKGEPDFNFGKAAFGLLMLIVLLLVLEWAMLFVMAGIIHIFVMLFGGKKGYTETLKVVSYSYAPWIFIFIPIVSFFAMAYLFILRIIGMQKRQGLSVGKSVAVVLLPLIIMAVLFVIFILAILGLKAV